jgi:hypothetical protein
MQPLTHATLPLLTVDTYRGTQQRVSPENISSAVVLLAKCVQFDMQPQQQYQQQRRAGASASSPPPSTTTNTSAQRKAAAPSSSSSAPRRGARPPQRREGGPPRPAAPNNKAAAPGGGDDDDEDEDGGLPPAFESILESMGIKKGQAAAKNGDLDQGQESALEKVLRFLGFSVRTREDEQETFFGKVVFWGKRFLAVVVAYVKPPSPSHACKSPHARTVVMCMYACIHVASRVHMPCRNSCIAALFFQRLSHMRTGTVTARFHKSDADVCMYAGLADSFME